jgi:signal transduction histidine kinase
MLTSFIFSPKVTLLYVGGVILLFIGTSAGEYFRIIPHYALNAAKFFPNSYRELIFPKTMGLCSTLFISAYMITSIKKRIEERGKRVEVELNRYKSLEQAKSNFILQVTHELRGPLAAIKGYLTGNARASRTAGCDKGLPRDDAERDYRKDHR